MTSATIVSKKRIFQMTRSANAFFEGFFNYLENRSSSKMVENFQNYTIIFLPHSLKFRSIVFSTREILMEYEKSVESDGKSLETFCSEVEIFQIFSPRRNFACALASKFTNWKNARAHASHHYAHRDLSRFIHSSVLVVVFRHHVTYS